MNRPYIDLPFPSEYRVEKDGDGYMIKVNRVMERRVFIEDMPSLSNLDPLIRSVMILVENEESMKQKEELDRLKSQVQNTNIKPEKDLIAEAERVLNG